MGVGPLSHHSVQEKVRERDRYQCILCERPSGEVHHVISRGREKAYPEVWDERNLVVLCHECHIDAPGGKGAHNQKGRLACIDYLIGHYGMKWYLQREPWSVVLRRGDYAQG